MGNNDVQTSSPSIRMCDICLRPDPSRSGTVGFCPHFYGALCVSDARFERPRLPCPALPKSVAVLIALVDANYVNDLISYADDKFADMLETMDFLSEGTDLERHLREGKKFWYIVSPGEPDSTEVSRGDAFITIAYGFSGIHAHFEETKFGRLKHKTYYFRDSRFALRKTRVSLQNAPCKTSFSAGCSVSGNQSKFTEQMGC